MKCKYCSDEVGNLIIADFRDDDFIVYMADNLITLIEVDDSGSSYLGDFIINYCPVCGKRIHPRNLD